MDNLPEGTISVSAQFRADKRIGAAIDRLQQLGVSVADKASDLNLGYDCELRLPYDVQFPMAVLVEIGYLLAQITEHQFPEEFNGFSSSTGVVPRWSPTVTSSDGRGRSWFRSGGRRRSAGIRFDVDPGFAYFRFDQSH